MRTFDEVVITKVRKVYLDVNEILRSIEKDLGTDSTTYENYQEKYSELQSILKSVTKKASKTSEDGLTEKRIRRLELLSESLCIIEEAHRDRELQDIGSLNIYKAHFSAMYEVLM